MSSIDQRVVQMLFDNATFEKGVATSLASLQKLNQSLQLQGATKGLTDVDDAAKNISLSGLASGVDAVAGKFSALSVVAISALAAITTKVVDAGIEVAKSFVIDPIKDGFDNYETQIQAVQTILANTGLTGAAGLAKVNTVLAQLNTYANQTVYNFSDMAKEIGTFTAAGVGLDESVNSIKGIANLAALSGASADQASSAMYQLSQAIAAGSVKLQDWNSVVNAGLGGKVLQTALINTARVSGVAIDSIIKKAGSFRNSLQQGWLTSTILTKTLTQFTGDLSVAQIKAMGYTAQQAQQIYVLSQTAVNAATKIKTLTQLTQALKEEVGTAYAAIFKTIFGNIDQATTLFSGIHTAAENALTTPIYELNALLQSWEALGGRTTLITAITHAFDILGEAMGIVSKAFRDVFPPETAAELNNLTNDFLHLVDAFKIGAVAQDELTRTFAGLFSIVSVVIFIIKQVAITIGTLLGVVGNSSGGFLKITANIGDFLVKMKNIIEDGQGVQKFFQKLATVLTVPILLFQELGNYVGSLFDRFDGTKATKALDDVAAKLSPIQQLGKLADAAWEELYDHLGTIAKFFAPLADQIRSFFSGLGKDISSGVGDLNFTDLLNTINTGLFAGILLLVKKFVTKFKGGEGSLGEFVDTIKETFEGLTGTLESMQNTLKAATLLEIAAAVAILTISLGELAKIDQAGLIRSSAAITVMFTQLLGSMVIFQKFIDADDAVKMVVMAGSLILFAAAIDILASTVKKLASLDWNGLAKGLTGLGIILAQLLVTLKLMGNPEGLIASGLGLTAFAKGVNVLATAVIKLSSLNWTQLAKGLSGVAVLLTSLGLFQKFAEADAAGIAQGAGIILLATAIKILASAMQQFSGLSWTQIAKGLVSTALGLDLIAGALAEIPEGSLLSAASVLVVAASLGLISDAIQKMGSFSWTEIAKGLISLAGALGLIAAALYLLPPDSLLSAAAIFVVAASLGMITDALVKMGGMSWTQIAKGLIELAAALTIIGTAVIFMEAALPGAAALLVVAGALLVLTPVLKAFGDMSWDSLAKSLVELAGVFAILGAAGVLLAPLVPILLGLGASILLLGIGMLAAGAGVLLFSAGLTALSLAGTAGAAALVAIVTAMIGLLPAVAKEIGLAIIAFSTTIATAGPAFTNAMVTILTSMINAVDTLTPKIVTSLLQLLTMLLQQLLLYVPKMVDAGGNLIISILEGIAKKTPGIVSAATDVIVAFINGISSNFARVDQAGINMILNFINSLANSIRNNIPAMDKAGENLASAIVDGMTGGMSEHINDVINEAKSLAEAALHAIAGVLHINSPSKETFKLGAFGGQGLALGFGSMTSVVADSAATVGKTAILAMSKSISGLSDLINDNVQVNPTITPVLDLSGVKKSASQLGNMLSTAPVSVTSSYNKAKIASAGYSANQFTSATDSKTTAPASPSVVFKQYNTSPKALSSADIYRQTKNGLSKVRGVLVYQGGSTD